MEQNYKEQFAEYIKTFKRNQHKKGFVASVTELQSDALNLVDVNPQVDSPLPRWAKEVLYMRGVSKRTKWLLLQYHDNQIRKYRSELARPTITIPTSDNSQQEDND